MHDGAGSILNRSNLGICGRERGARWGKGTIVTYAKFYVKILQKSGLPHLRMQATVRPSFRQEPAGITISRRCAAANRILTNISRGDARIRSNKYDPSLLHTSRP